MKAQIRAAFEAVRNRLSPDRVVADPELNAAFLAECRRIGLTGQAREFNRALLNLRKRGGLADLQSSARTLIGDDDSYRYASELAIRFLERRDGVTLDDVICDPEFAAEFDKLAAQVSPGFSSFEYRWAALRLRKTSRLRPEILARAVASQQVLLFQVATLDLTSIPAAAGLYLFSETAQALYVGEAESLRQRVRKHLDHSDRKDLARWLWEFGSKSLVLEVHVLDANVSKRVRRALETELIRSRNPLFNVQR